MEDAHLKAARMRWYGVSRREIASKLDVPETTVRAWEKTSWWPDAMAEASRLGHEKMVGSARRVVQTVLERALDPEAPTPILKEASVLSRWYLERRDPELKAANSIAAEESRAIAKLSKMLESLAPEELAALANEPVIFGFPDQGTSSNDEGEAEPASLSKLHES